MIFASAVDLVGHCSKREQWILSYSLSSMASWKPRTPLSVLLNDTFYDSLGRGHSWRSHHESVDAITALYYVGTAKTSM